MSKEGRELEGDVAEFGVYKGRSLLGTALILESINQHKKVYGFDSFSGLKFAIGQNDSLVEFEKLHNAGEISFEQFSKVNRNTQILTFLKGDLTAANISTSGDFSDTNLSEILKKISFLNLKNIELVEGPFSETLLNKSPTHKDLHNLKFSAVMFDCDLYESYNLALVYAWPKLVSGGMMFFDEYYSLKFPGAKISCDNFFSDKKNQITWVKEVDFSGWERNYVIKN